jgi:hypothetical protein
MSKSKRKGTVYCQGAEKSAVLYRISCRHIPVKKYRDSGGEGPLATARGSRLRHGPAVPDAAFSRPITCPAYVWGRKSIHTHSLPPHELFNRMSPTHHCPFRVVFTVLSPSFNPPSPVSISLAPELQPRSLPQRWIGCYTEQRALH